MGGFGGVRSSQHPMLFQEMYQPVTVYTLYNKMQNGGYITKRKGRQGIFFFFFNDNLATVFEMSFVAEIDEYCLCATCVFYIYSAAPLK